MIRRAATPADYEAFAHLCRDYVDWCRARYADLPGLVEDIFGYQSLDAELTSLAAKYGGPNGATLLAEHDGAIVGGGAYRRLAPGVCELKRLFLGDGARGAGLGRALASALIEAARLDGFRLARLDTGDRMTEAIALYASLGFRKVDPYQTYPEHVMAHLVFMEREL